MLTYEEVNSLFNYDPVTGVIRRVKSGIIAGSKTGKGYWEISVTNLETRKRDRMYAHRMAWLLTYGDWPKKHIDHINGYPSDNRLSNLREVNNQENHKNMKQHIGNSSGYTGVYWNKRAKKWQAYICVDGKQQYLGVFTDIDEAAQARVDADKEYKYHKNHGRVEEAQLKV